jgi:hypothetical protein
MSNADHLLNIPSAAAWTVIGASGRGWVALASAVFRAFRIAIARSRAFRVITDRIVFALGVLTIDIPVIIIVDFVGAILWDGRRCGGSLTGESKNVPSDGLVVRCVVRGCSERDLFDRCEEIDRA